MGNCLPLLTSEQKVRRAKRVSLIQQLPKGAYYHEGGREDSVQECVICLVDPVRGNTIRCLPCMHLFHVDCVDEWLVSGITCPCCRWLVLECESDKMD